MANRDLQHWLIKASGLCLFGVAIWIFAASRYPLNFDNLWILLAFPALIWLGQFSFQNLKSSEGINPKALYLALSCLVLGMISGSITLLAASWAVFAFPLLKQISPESPGRLAIIGFCGFPWILCDFEAISWFFRLSGATTTAQIFALSGFDVEQQGVFLNVQGLPVSIEPACSGMDLLQLLAVAGACLSTMIARSKTAFAICILCIAPICWLANTIRILAITVAALTVDTEFASGAFHTWGALIVIGGVVIICWQVFSLIDSLSNRLIKG